MWGAAPRGMEASRHHLAQLLGEILSGPYKKKMLLCKISFQRETSVLGENVLLRRLGIGAGMEEPMLIWLMTEPKVQAAFLEAKQASHLLCICLESTWMWYLKGEYLGACHNQRKRRKSVAAPKTSVL